MQYFYKRTDGKIISLSEAHAVHVHHKFEFIGTSDGKTHKKVYSEGQNNLLKIDEELDPLKEELEDIEDEIAELDEEDEEGMKELRRKRGPVRRRVRELQKQRRNEASDLQQRAFNAELEAAKANKTPPPQLRGSEGGKRILWESLGRIR